MKKHQAKIIIIDTSGWDCFVHFQPAFERHRSYNLWSRASKNRLAKAMCNHYRNFELIEVDIKFIGMTLTFGIK